MMKVTDQDTETEEELSEPDHDGEVECPVCFGGEYKHKCEVCCGEGVL